MLNVCIYVRVPYVCLVPEEAVDPLKLGLQTVVSLHVGAGSQTLVLCQSSERS